ncbi:hypothetical protein [Streptomyces sp. NRRL F-2580]|uniref:hypothetical protein n=1 Tax=Streptomyces sp. NRRL F-2580 TaxID=1463841 RepID=UPI0004CC6AF8|nr:hypothetical protein [Streptomyces sp. NRRL F-2580]
MHDQTAARTEDIAEESRRHPKVKAKIDEGYRVALDFPAQVSAPPKKPKGDAPPGEHHAWREQRRRQSSARICGVGPPASGDVGTPCTVPGSPSPGRGQGSLDYDIRPSAWP